MHLYTPHLQQQLRGCLVISDQHLRIFECQTIHFFHYNNILTIDMIAYRVFIAGLFLIRTALLVFATVNCLNTVCLANPRQELLDSANSGWKKLDETYSYLSFTATLRYRTELVRLDQGGQPSEKKIQFRYKGDGVRLLLDGQLEYAGKGDSPRRVVGKNESYFFQLRESPSGLILDKSGGPNSEDNGSDLAAWVGVYRPATTITCLKTHHLPEFLLDANTQVISTEAFGSLQRVKYNYSQKTNPGKTQRVEGYFDLDPMSNWRVVESGFSVPERKFSGETKVVYFSTKTGDRVESLISKSDAPHGKIWESIQFNDFSDAKIDPQLFYLSHYGLPEPPGITPPSRPTPTYLWLLLGAGGLFVLSVVCRWLLKRRTRTVPPTPTA